MLFNIVSLIANIAYLVVLNLNIYTDRAVLPGGQVREWHRSPAARLELGSQTFLLYLQIVLAAVSIITAVLLLFGVAIGDVLMGVNKTKAASRIIVGLPYVQQVVVHKVLPGTVRFSLVECKAMAAAQSEFGKVWLVNADGKLLESLDNSENIGYPLIQGPVLDLPTGGDPVTFDDPEAGELGMQTAAELTAAGVSDQITIIDVSDPASIKLSYQDRIEVQLGDGTDLQYRIQYMIGALEKLSGNAKGVLDLTFALGEQAVFHPLA